MKNVLLSIALCASVASVAQQALVINNANIKLESGAHNYKTLGTNGLASPTQGANQTWNYSSAQPVGDFLIFYDPASNPSFPGATLSLDNSIPIIQGRVWYITHFFGTYADGLKGIGYKVQEQRYGIGDLTQNNSDSLIMDEQNVLYTGDGRLLLKYPTTEGSKWSAKYVDEIKFSVTVGAFFLNKAPGIRRMIYTEDYEVLGWGKSSFQINGEASNPEDALLIKRTRTMVDSFYLNGQPAPQALLMAFGISQGQKSSSYRMALMIPNIQPRAVFWYDSAFSKIDNAEFMTNDLTSGSSSVNETSLGSLQIFPSPLSGNQIFISGLHNASSVTSAELLDITGKRVAVLSISPTSSSTMTAEINRKPTAGLYLLRMHGENGQSGTVRISIQ